jgi:hypothetical protein
MARAALEAAAVRSSFGVLAQRFRAKAAAASLTTFFGTTLLYAHAFFYSNIACACI